MSPGDPPTTCTCITVKDGVVIPDASSVAFTAIVTGTALWFGGQMLLWLATAVIVGAVLSILIGPKVTGSATLPALSMQLPLLITLLFAPSSLTVAPASVFVAMPEGVPPASAQVNV